VRGSAVTRAPLYERAAVLIEQLFDAPYAARGWSGFLAALCREMSTDAVAVLIGQVEPAGRTLMVAHGIDLASAPTDELLPTDEESGEQEVPVGSVVAIEAANECFARTRLYEKILATAGLPPGPALWAVLARDPRQITGALLVLSRDRSWQPTADDRALLELLAPYVRRAVIVGLRLNERRSDVETLLGVFDALALGVVLLDAKGRVSFANRSALEMLRGTPGPALPEDGASPASRDRRTEALRAVLRSRAIGPRAAALAHPEDGRPLQIVATPLRWPDADTEVAARFTSALFLGDPGAGERGAVAGLAALYGLTPAEERLASLLAAGCSLAEAAARLSIRVSTARSVLKSVFAKTGTRRQASLVKLILAAPGLLRRGSPEDAKRPSPSHRP
jgi:DNA-binding CsgD family transcriptional regulator/PAS domain-containing protein